MALLYPVGSVHEMPIGLVAVTCTQETETLLTAFHPITPQQAIAIAEGAGVHDARRVIVDYAAAGIVKGYALVCETMMTSERRTSRGAAISIALWKRLQREGLSDQVWNGGTLRLEADPLNDLPEVSITGVSFSQASLQRLVNHHGGGTPTAHEPAQPPKVVVTTARPIASSRLRPDPSAIPAGAITVTVNQAMAALGLGRTKINALMNDGRLVRIKYDRSTRIEVESIRLLAGVPS